MIFWKNKKEVEVLKQQLEEKRPLPTGVTEFHEWSDRIISGAGLPASVESQKFALANDLMHCPPNMAFESDVYFIHRLRKYAVNQVADAIRNQLKEDQMKEDQKAKAAQTQPADVTAPQVDDAKVLEIKRV